jgi:hypothetical protein
LYGSPRSPIRHHDHQIPQAQFKARVPAHAPNDDLSVEVPSSEQIFDRDEPLHLFIIARLPRVCTRAILGTDAACLFEEDFCKTSGCPPEKLSDFLGAKWNQHHARRVARREETASPFPVLLIRRRGLIYSLEVWSPKDVGDALNVAPLTRELSNEDMAKLLAILHPQRPRIEPIPKNIGRD